MTSSPISPSLEHAVPVEQADRETVDLRLDDVGEAGLLDALAGEVVAHPLDPRPQLVPRAHVAERQHRLQMADFLEARDRLTADSLRRRVGRQQLGVLTLDPAQLVEQAVIDIVADLGIVEDVVAVGVVFELLAQLGGAERELPRRLRRSRLAGLRAGRGHGAASGAGRSEIDGSSRPSRSKRLSASRLAWSVRSKWIGVTAMRPACTAARSVPGSSWKPG